MLLNSKCKKIFIFLFFISEIFILTYFYHVTSLIFYLIVAEITILIVITNHNNNDNIQIIPINPIETFELNNEEINQFHKCVICLMEEPENVIKLKCQHMFHKDCINKWFQHSNRCPICRTNLRDFQDTILTNSTYSSDDEISLLEENNSDN